MTLQVRVLGIAVQFSDIDTQEGYKRVSDAIQSLLSPFKPALDLINIAIQIREVLEAAVDIPTDPAEFLSRLADLTAMITALGQYIPQLTVPYIVKDGLDVAIAMTTDLESKLETMEAILTKKAGIEAKVPLDEALQDVADLVQEQYDEQVAELQKMLEPIEAILAILNVFGSLIGFQVSVAVPIDTTSLEVIRQSIEDLNEALVRLRDNVP